MARNLSQAQINRRKKAGAHLTQTTSAIGLGSLAALGASKGHVKLAQSGKLTRVSAEKAGELHNKVKGGLISTGIVSSGIGGLNGFNNASWQGAEARQRKQKIVKSAAEDGFYGSSYDSEEVSKLGSPKVRMQELTVHERRGNTTKTHEADTISAKYKGKSLILRRPKYQTVAYPSAMNTMKARKDTTHYVSPTANVRIRSQHARKVDAAYQGKKKSIELAGQKAKFEVQKSAFGVDHD